MTIAAIGIDAGSTTCKIVAVGEHGEVLHRVIEPAHPRIGDQAGRMVAEAADRLGPLDGSAVVATGYGRKLVDAANRRVTEITCHAGGAFAELGRPGTLIDIGGQDSKVIRIGLDGRPTDFVMNDKCAAGTGRFLEHTASRLSVPIEDMGSRALEASGEARITSTCTVFAESEIVSLLADGVEVGPILAGLHRSLVGRIASMVRTLGWEEPVVLSGGVALNAAIAPMIGEALGTDVTVAAEPQTTGALGAALVGLANPEGTPPSEGPG